MIKNPHVPDVSSKQIVVVYKHSRFTYAKDHGFDQHINLNNDADPIVRDLRIAHENNLKCVDSIKSALDELQISYRIICRTDMTTEDLKNNFVIAVGGDGTILDTSHYCDDSPMLGVNSDPRHSVGALCVASSENFSDIIREIYQGKLFPTPLTRLSIKIDERPVTPLALNDVLFCHKNPASMSRFILSFRGQIESHRSSGIWFSTAAGSTGGIYSSGAEPLNFEDDLAIFRVREPYWTDQNTPNLLHGSIKRDEIFSIRSNMTDAEIFIDGPHKTFAISLGESVSISLSDRPLWLFDGPRLNKNRMEIIKQRKSIKNFL